MAAAAAFTIPAATAVPMARAALTEHAASSAPHRSAEPAGARHREWRRLRAYEWAASRAGDPYQWGGTGPGFDCSGLVMMAYRHAGVYLPRTTTEMLASRLLVRIWHPRMGDLAFYGPWHVELFRKWGYTFGAHDAGSLVGLVHYGWWWRPTAFYRVR
jgi:cell wall-associated NlpC family hydrolase